jgi:hypothetical protein
MDILYWYYVQSKKNKDMVGSIIQQFIESGHIAKSRIAVIQQLLQQDIISTEEFDELMKYEDSQYERDEKISPAAASSSAFVGPECAETQNNDLPEKPADDIKVLRDRLLKEDKSKMITWLQSVLLECCFVKLNVYSENLSTMSPTETLPAIDFPDKSLGSSSSAAIQTQVTTTKISITNTIISTSCITKTTTTSTTTMNTILSSSTTDDQFKQIMEPVPLHCIS